MSETITHWELRRGDLLLGFLTAYAWDYPWLDCDFEPTEAFDEYRDVFEGDFRLLNPGMESDQYSQMWEAAFDKIAGLQIWFAPADDAAQALRAELINAQDRRPWIRAILGA